MFGLIAIAAPLSAQAVPITVVSDQSWSVLDASMNPLGHAQMVCLNNLHPWPCPGAAVHYRYNYPGWTADRSTIPGAQWIWAPGITFASGSAGNATYVFEKLFYLCGAPVDGWIRIAADDSATVEVNGQLVGTAARQDTLEYFAIPAASLSIGANVIRVTVRNGADPPRCASLYSCNPAGFVFGASFTDALPSWPQCAGGVSVGTTEPRPCPPGLEGSAFRTCLCAAGNASWSPIDTNGCFVPPPPPTCPGLARPYNIGETEQLVCPTTPPVGNTSHVCRADGTWDRELGHCAPPPPVTCVSNGVTFAVGQVETIPCASPVVGSTSRTCGPTGQFGPTTGACSLPAVGAGAVCGNRYAVPPIRATCPAGTECLSRTTRVCEGWWIFSSCTYVQSVDMFCL